MNIMNTEEHIQAFWDWFRENQDSIVDAVRERDSSWLARNLAPRLRQVSGDRKTARLNWEIGKGTSRVWSFSVSPTVKENIELAASVVRHAPETPEWEFHLGRQAKPNWDFCLTLPDDTGAELHIDASEWRYLVKHTDKGAYILFVTTCLPTASEQLRTRIAYLILDSVLGEMFVLEHVAGAFLLDETRVGEASGKQSIRLLRNDFYRTSSLDDCGK